jgi:hypothetical protein
MSGSLYQEVISLLTIPPGNLVYHLVLAFSIAGALPGALNLWQRDGLEAGRRMVIGLGLLLLAQFTLVIDAGLAQFFPLFEALLPILDRATNALSLVILIWLWVYPERSRRADSASLLLGVLILLLAVITGLWWLNQSDNPFFNGSIADLLWAGLSLVLAFAGGLLLVIRRPDGYGIGLGMFSLLFLGQLVYLVDPLPAGNYPGVVRITQIAAYPLLLTLPARFSLGKEVEDHDPHGLDPVTFRNFQTIATSSDPLQVCQSITVVVSRALYADLCLLISPPDANKHISLHCGYDLSRQGNIGAATFDSNLVPVLSESLRQGRPLHLPTEGNIPDLAGFEKILNLPLSGSLLSAPIFTRSGELDKALVLLTPDSGRSWTAADQNFLADIAASLTDIFEYKNEYLAHADQLAQSNKTLGNIQAENDRLNDEIIELTARTNASAEKIEQLQAKLQSALYELEARKTQAQEKGLPE